MKLHDDYQPEISGNTSTAPLYALDTTFNPPLDNLDNDANDFTNNRNTLNQIDCDPVDDAPDNRVVDCNFNPNHPMLETNPTSEISPNRKAKDTITIDDSHFWELESDGEPMVTSTKHAQLMFRIANGVKKCLPSTFVAMDLIWYPRSDNLLVATAPDVMAILGVPRQHLSRYKQWEHHNIAPQVVFEILSTSNKPPEMSKKLVFYQQYGVQEYYIHNPDNETLQGYIRDETGQKLVLLSDAEMNGWQSPLIGMYFRYEANEWQFYTAKGERFVDFEEIDAELSLQKQQTEIERQRAEQQQQQAEAERQQRETAEAKIAELAAKLRALGVEINEK
jgi:Uma2 family endonuclease